MHIRTNADNQFSTARFFRLITFFLAESEIVIYSFMEILGQTVDRIALKCNTVLMQPNYLSEKAVVFFRKINATRVSFIMQLSHIR